MDKDDFEKIWHFTFGVQRLTGLASSISQWMESRTSFSSNEDVTRHARLAAVAHAYFDASHDYAGLRADYVSVLESISILEKQHSAFLASPQEASIAAHLLDTQHVLNTYSDIVEKMEYPGAETDALSLKGEARKCLALQLSK